MWKSTNPRLPSIPSKCTSRPLLLPDRSTELCADEPSWSLSKVKVKMSIIVNITQDWCKEDSILLQFILAGSFLKVTVGVMKHLFYISSRTRGVVCSWIPGSVREVTGLVILRDIPLKEKNSRLYHLYDDTLLHHHSCCHGNQPVQHHSWRRIDLRIDYL